MDPTLAGEWKTATQQSGMVCVTDRALIGIEGKDRAEFLQGIFSADVKKNFPEGNFVYGLFPDLKGKILSDAFVLHLSGIFYLDLPKSGLPVVWKQLEQYCILMEAEMKNFSEEYELISLLGPLAPAPLQKTFGIQPPPEGKCQAIGGGNGFVFPWRLREFQEYRLWGKEPFLSETRQKLLDSGVSEVGEKTYETIHIESGIPALGREMDNNTFPAEVGLEQFVDFKKGCFLGAEVLQRIFYQGHVNRTLALFSFEFPATIQAGSPIHQGELEIGKISATAFSFRHQKPVALGLVKAGPLESETALTAFSEGKPVPLQILRSFSPSKAAG